MLELEDTLEMILSILLVTHEETEAQWGIGHSTPIQMFQDLRMSIIRLCNDRITSVVKELGLGLIYL